MVIAPLSLNQASLLSLCFLKEITDDGVAVEPIEVIDRVIPYDEYWDEMDMDMMGMSQITSVI